ncbi:Brp/Blh family beta-carotene 15,15'-dioxygenase [Kordia sp. YSTF-M3]|uniref:Probable beta-carotene 15,15'-dioxygenase n=1 Tax=Kordia aestuariivivens TaxID=2759037 RepID=A0ABR7Q7P1_9FLAO|nr:Brp/Blh family beta-carotene 15,15'-dioxygenase [Kordia aestuariivivens]MBC8754586.1 Brp/Blh family beta-carotene 15,15'-dioxygenase [Kordia aestuariivivens]
MRSVLNVDYQDFMIIVTFFLFWISIQFGQVIEDTIAYIFVLSLGIIHGANDLNILQKKQLKKNNFIKSLFLYLLLISLCVVSFWIHPFTSVLLFIVLSAYHFGEQHLEKKISSDQWLQTIIFIAYGLVIFTLLFYVNVSDVNSIVSNLTNHTIDILLIEISFVIAISTLATSLLYAHYKKHILHLNYLKEFLYLFVLFLVFKTGTLIFGFAVYFVFWHSIPSITDQIHYLFGSKNKHSIANYFKAAFFYWLLSISGLVVAYYFMEEQLFNAVLFLILFAVTTPHTWVMKRMKE